MVCKDWAAASAIPSELWRQASPDSGSLATKIGAMRNGGQWQRIVITQVVRTTT